MNVEPSVAWIVDPSPPVIALDTPGAGWVPPPVPPPPPPELGPGEPPDVFGLATFDLGLITVKYTGTTTAIIIKTKASKRMAIRIRERRFDFGDGAMVSSANVSGFWALSNSPEPFSVGFRYDESRGESETTRGEELVAK